MWHERSGGTVIGEIGRSPDILNKALLAEQLYEKMALIRCLEEVLLELFTNGELFGTTHTCIGQEAIAVATMAHVEEGDFVFSSHRGHGHYIAYGAPLDKLVAEIMGRKTGVCGGRGGSQHLNYRKFYTNGVQGGIVAHATGAALAEMLQGSGGIAFVFIGDGTLGEGLVYESLNFASLWSIPVLYILENNRYAQSTPIHLGVSGSIINRPKSFGIEADEVESNDALLLYEIFKERAAWVRGRRAPFFQIVHTYRQAPHSKGDDYRDRVEIELWRQKDPLLILGQQIPEDRRKFLDKNAQKQVKEAVEFARSSPFPLVHDVDVDNPKLISPPGRGVAFPKGQGRVTVVQILNQALHDLMELNERVVVIGEDLLDPYGGAFKVTRGLSTKFPGRVLSTPISEAGIIGLSVGLALQGMRPIAEIMFGDFMALCADQLLNHAAKYRWMFNNQVRVPLVVRTPMGGRRGYGPTHSQSIEKMFMGIPGLAVVSPSHLHDPGELLKRATLECEDPVLFVENKLLYSLRLLVPSRGRVGAFFIRSTDSRFPTIHLSLAEFNSPDATIITYSANLVFAMEAAETLLLHYEILTDIIVPSLISPVPLEEIKGFYRNSRVLTTLEEGTERLGWGAEIITALEIDRSSYSGKRKYQRFAAANCSLPSSKPLELGLLPNLEAIVNGIRSLV